MWYVLQTMSGEEQKCINLCSAILDRECYNEFFIPRHIIKKRYCKEWHDKLKVMFPGYVFVDSNSIEELYEQLRIVPQLTKMLRNADKVSPITLQEQEFLSGIMDEDYIVRYSEGFIVGQRVCITEGALRDVSGHIKKVDRHRRIAYLDIDFFGRDTPVEVGLSAVARVTEEEFEKIRQRNIDENEKMNQGNAEYNDESEDSSEEDVKRSRVQILDGMFKGMYGTFLAADTDRDEWIVLMKLFGSKPSRVVFHRSEIRML